MTAKDERAPAREMSAESVRSEVWLVDLEASCAALEELERETPRLPADSLDPWAAMKDARARRERRLAHIALRLLLERTLGREARGRPFAKGAAGKPFLPGVRGFDFNLSHAGGYALMAVGPDRVGVDVETPRVVRIPKARRPAFEQAAIALAGGAPLPEEEGDARFLRAWVRLEAVVKAQGRGLAPLLEGLRPGRDVLTGEGFAAREGRGIVARDVAVPEGVFAAIALPAGAEVRALVTLPATRRGIEALLETGSPTRR